MIPDYQRIAALTHENAELRARAEKAEADEQRYEAVISDLRDKWQKAECDGAVLREALEQSAEICRIRVANEAFMPFSSMLLQHSAEALTDTQAGARLLEVVSAAEEWQQLHKEAARINHDEVMPYEAFLYAMQLAETKRDDLFDLLDAYRQGGQK